MQVHHHQGWHFSTPAADVEALVILHKRFPRHGSTEAAAPGAPEAHGRAANAAELSAGATSPGEGSAPLLTTLPLGVPSSAGFSCLSPPLC